MLRVCGTLVRQALALRPKARRFEVLAGAADAARRASWTEALHAAVAAHTFSMPSAAAAAAKAAKPTPEVAVRPGTGLDLSRATATATAGNLVRHLTALPPNVLDAAAYRRLLGTLARRHGLAFTWHDETRLRREQAGAFLAVARGNARRDGGIAQLRYRPPRRGRARTGERPVALVGKGILFDTGGVNLKAHRHMLDMHTDMSGSAVALATLLALAELKYPHPVDAWLAITENAIGPAAYRPQEIIRAANGTTIQVIHSDAEGRLALADTLVLAGRMRPALMIDFATLTGACVGALTERMSGVFSNRGALVTKAQAAGAASGERVWGFPLDDDYDSDIESPVADVAQCAVEGKGDHIHAARFLQRFVPPNVPWLHVDLASATRRGGLGHVPTEITGFGPRFALSLLLDQGVLE